MVVKRLRTAALISTNHQNCGCGEKNKILLNKLLNQLSSLWV